MVGLSAVEAGDHVWAAAIPLRAACALSPYGLHCPGGFLQRSRELDRCKKMLRSGDLLLMHAHTVKTTARHPPLKKC